MSVSGIEEGWVSATDIGYQLGPRINAAGRLHLATDVIELFQSKSIAVARLKAREIDQFNVERRAIESKLVEDTMATLPQDLPDFILISGEESAGWHRGVGARVYRRPKQRLRSSTDQSKQWPCLFGGVSQVYRCCKWARAGCWVLGSARRPVEV